MTEIYLIRHTQAEGNLYRVIQGHWDGNVTTLGLKQIDALAERFREVKVDALYASDLYRARLTAQGIRRWHALPLITDPRLREINMGPWERRSFPDLMHEQHEEVTAYLAHPSAWSHKGAETYAQVTERAWAALMDIVANNEGKSVVIVTHGVTLLCLLSRALGLPLEDHEALPVSGNTGVTHLFYENDAFRCDYMGDMSHLASFHLPPWNQTPALRAEAIDPLRERDYYTRCYADSWRCVHGSLDGFDAESYLQSAASHHRADPGAVLKLYDGDEAVGLVDMDTRRSAHAGVGWISLLYLREDYRGRGVGVQLLGRAVMHYLALGRRCLRLHVAEKNQAARRFYERWGFEALSYEPTERGRLLLMEKLLDVRYEC